MTTGSVAITAGAGTPIRIVTNAGVDSGADQQVMTLADAAGNLLIPASLVMSGTATNSVAVNATPGAAGTIGHAAATITAAVTTAAAFIAAPAAGLSIYITDINVTNGGASATLVSLFAAGQTVPLAAKSVAATTSAPPTSYRTPVRVGTATALNYTNSVASTSVFVQVTYYIAA